MKPLRRRLLMFIAVAVILLNAAALGQSFSFTQTTVPTEAQPDTMALADFDGDGQIDIVVSIYKGSSPTVVSVFRNISSSGAIAFAPAMDFAVGSGAEGVAAGDLDGDGKPDIICANAASDTVSFLRNTSTTGSLSFDPRVDVSLGGNPHQVTVVSFDGDSKPDIAVTRNAAKIVSVLRNTSTVGSLSFSDALDITVPSYPSPIISMDIDPDGRMDLVVPMQNINKTLIYRNTTPFAGGSFSVAAPIELLSSPLPGACAANDLEDGGTPEIVVANSGDGVAQIGTSVSVFWNSGSSTFPEKIDLTTPPTPHGVVMADLDKDGKNEVIVAAAGSDLLSIFKNTRTTGLPPGDIRFGPRQDFATGSVPTQVLAADFDKDGYIDLIVLNQNGQSLSLYRNSLAVISSIVPNVGPATGGQTVVITGSSLDAATVTIGNTPAIVVSNTTTEITFTTPPHVAGVVDVTVSTAQGSATATGAYTYVDKPTITSVFPNSGPAAGGQSVTISGTGLNGATVTFGGTAATVTGTTATTASVTTPAHAAAPVDVVVTTVAGAATATAGYTYLAPPVISNITPVSGTVAGGTSVTITGSNFVSGATVRFDSAAGTSTSVINSTTITTVTPSVPAGTVNVTVTNPDGQSATVTNGYAFVTAPVVTGVTPNFGSTAGGTSITVAGNNFAAGATLKLGGNAAAGVSVVSTTSITATTPAASAGAVDVVVTNPDGQFGTLPSGYTYFSPPDVTLLTPATGPTGGGTSVVITGTNLGGATSVTFGGVAGTITAATPTSITVTTPAHPAESSVWHAEAQITVFTGDGLQKIAVSGARDSDGFPLPEGDTRFGFVISTSGTSSMSLQATGRGERVDLSWTPSDVETLAGYNVYRSTTTGGPYTKISSALVLTTAYSDLTARPGTAYYYVYRVVDTALNEGANSNEAAASAIDDLPPVITHVPIVSAPVAMPITVAASIVDNVSVSSASLYYRLKGAPSFANVAMINATGTQFSANIPGSAATSPGVEYYIEATDGTNTGRSGSPSQPYLIVIGGSAVKGDANGDTTIDATDVIYLLNYLFKGGTPPIGSSDVNGDGKVDVADVFYLINYIFAGGPAPR